MRRVVLSGALAVVAAGCGGGGSGSASADDIAQAATKTSQAGSLEANFNVAGQGLTGKGSGVFNSKQHSGQLKMTLLAGGRQVPVESVVDGNTLYLRSPAFAQATTQDKQWVKLNLATLSATSGRWSGRCPPTRR